MELNNKIEHEIWEEEMEKLDANGQLPKYDPFIEEKIKEFEDYLDSYIEEQIELKTENTEF